MKQLDRKTREVINKYSGRNRKSSVAMTYLSYDQGGYNLSELEMVYKLLKIKIAHHIATSTDQRINLVMLENSKTGKNIADLHQQTR